MLSNLPSRFRSDGRQGWVSPNRVRSIPKTELSLERRRLAEKQQNQQYQQREYANPYQLGRRATQHNDYAFSPRNRVRRERSPHELFRPKRFRLLDIPFSSNKENRLKRSTSDKRLQGLVEETTPHMMVSQAYQLKLDIKREMEGQAISAYEEESNANYHRKDQAASPRLPLTMRERLKKQLLQDSSVLNQIDASDSDRYAPHSNQRRNPQLSSQLSGSQANAAMQTDSHRLVAHPDLYDSLTYTKHQKPYEQLGIHTKSPDHGFIEQEQSISGFALDDSVAKPQNQSIKKKIMDDERLELQASAQMQKSSSIRAILRSQVMREKPKDLSDSRASNYQLPGPIYDPNDSVNYSPYVLQKSNLDTERLQRSSAQAQTTNLQSSAPFPLKAPNIHILQSLDFVKGGSNSQINDQRRSQLIFYEKHSLQNQTTPAMATFQNSNANFNNPHIVAASTDPYGLQQVRMVSNYQPHSQDHMNSPTLRRFTSNGSSIKTPDFSQPSSLVQEQMPLPSGVMRSLPQLPPSPSMTAVFPAAQHSPSRGQISSQHSMTSSIPNITVTPPNPYLANSIKISPQKEPLQQGNTFSPRYSPSAMSASLQPDHIRQLNEAVIKLFYKSQQQPPRAIRPNPPPPTNPLSNTSISITTGSEVPALQSNDNFRETQKALLQINSSKSPQPSQLQQQSNIQSQNASISHLNNTSAEGNDTLYSEPMETLEKLVQYLEILDSFGSNIVQFDHMVSETGKSDGLVNFYLYKRFLKEKKKLEDCIKGGPNIFDDLDFLTLTDSELHEFRQDPQNQSVLEMIEDQNRKVFSSLKGIMEFFKGRFKIFPKANLDLDEDFEYETVYYLNKEVEGLQASLKNQKLPSQKRKEAYQRQVFLYESLFLIEFFNGRFLKSYEDYNQVEDLDGYLKSHRKSYSEEVTKYLIKRP